MPDEQPRQIRIALEFDLIIESDGRYMVHMREPNYAAGIKGFIGEVRREAGCWQGYPKGCECPVYGQFVEPEQAAKRLIQTLLQQ